MNIRSRKALRQTAAASLAAAPGSPQRVALVYGGIACGLSLLSAVISFMLSNEIAGTGGLSNMGLRSILSTAQSILPLVQMVVLLCMELGYNAATLNMARGHKSEPRTLLEGFRRFGPLIRAYLLQSLIYFSIAVIAVYVSSYIFIFLPVSQPFLEIMEPILASMNTMDAAMPVLDDETLITATTAMVPMLWIFAAVFCILVTPVTYQYRMVPYCLCDAPRPGALAAMRESRAMMRRNRFALFRLDLGFWWYYLLQILIAVVAYGDMLLPLMGVRLPWSDTASYFLFYALSLLVQLAVYCFFMNRVHVTYATAYESLRPQPQEPRYPMSM